MRIADPIIAVSVLALTLPGALWGQESGAPDSGRGTAARLEEPDVRMRAASLPTRSLSTSPGNDGFFGDLGGGITSLGKDAADFVAEPFRLTERQWVGVALVVGGGLLVMAADQPIYDFVTRTQGEEPWATIVEVGDFFEPLGLMTNTAPVWLAGMGVSYLAGHDPTLRVFQQMLYSNLISSVTMAVPRPLIGRVRPRNAGDDPYVFRPFDGTSLPSGHAATIFGVSRAVATAVDWWPASVALYAVAGAVAYQRLADETGPATGEGTKRAPHWASDVYFGAWYGLVAANVVLANDEAEANPRVETGIGVTTGALEVRVRFAF